MFMIRVNIVNMLVLPNLIYRFNTIPIKIPASNFVDIDTVILKYIWRGKRPTIANATQKKKKEDPLPNFQTYY